MVTTLGKSVPPQAIETFSLIEMDTPVNATIGTPFTVTIRITEQDGSSQDLIWDFFRDNGGELKIDLYADTIGPGTDLQLLTHTEALVPGQDAYTIDLKDDTTLNSPTFPATAVQGVYELAAVITVRFGGVSTPLSAFVGDVILQVS